MSSCTALSAQGGSNPGRDACFLLFLSLRKWNVQSIWSTSVGICGWATHQERRAFQQKEQRFLPRAWCKAGLFLVTVQMFGSEADFYQLPKKGLTCGLDLMAEVFFM